MIIAVVLAVFLAILFFTDMLGNMYGEKAEQLSLAGIAAVLVGLLIWNHRSGD